VAVENKWNASVDFFLWKEGVILTNNTIQPPLYIKVSEDFGNYTSNPKTKIDLSPVNHRPPKHEPRSTSDHHKRRQTLMKAARSSARHTTEMHHRRWTTIGRWLVTERRGRNIHCRRKAPNRWPGKAAAAASIINGAVEAHPTKWLGSTRTSATGDHEDAGDEADKPKSSRNNLTEDNARATHVTIRAGLRAAY
jgi:hypothetical protein